MATLETGQSHLQAFMTVKGVKQGDIKSDAIVQGPYKDKIRLLDFELAALAPFDVQTGHATGKRQHKPFVFETEVDTSTPKFLMALCTNETLSDVSVGVYRKDMSGKEENYLKMKFTNANISKYEMSGNPTDAHHATIRYELTFQKIEVDTGKVSMMDSWMLTG